MKKNIIVVFIVWITELFALKQWAGCWHFIDHFYFTQQTLSLTLLDTINAEKGLPLLFIRLLHNKVFGLVWGIIQTILQYWDIRFLIEFLGIIGGIGVYLGLWYLFTKRKKSLWVWLVCLLICVLSFIELFFIPHIQYKLRIVPLALAFQILSLFGIWHFLQKKRELIVISIIVGLIIFTILSFMLTPVSYQLFCLKV